MNHTEFFAALKRGEIAACYLFEGEEELVKHSALAALKKAVLTGDFDDMNDLRLFDPSGDALIAANETLPFMADKRILTVHGCGMLQGKPTDYSEEDSVAKLREYFKSLPDFSCLVFYVRGKADARKKLYQALKKCAVIVQFDKLKDNELTRWLVKSVRARGKQMSEDTCAHLFFTVGRDLNKLSTEIEKLCAYAGEREEITPDDLDVVCAKTTEFKVFELSNVLLEGQGEKAFQMLEGLLKEGEDRLYLLALLSRAVRQLLAARRGMEGHLSTAQIAGQIGVPTFFIARTLAQARRYTLSQLEALAKSCVTMEYEVKSGQMAAEGSLEKIMLECLQYQRG